MFVLFHFARCLQLTQITMQKIKAVIFDLDGTIANTIPLVLKAFRLAVEPLVHKDLSDQEIMDTFGPTEEGSVKKLAPDNYKKGTADFLEYYESFHDMCPEPFEGIPDLLKTLKSKNVRIALATGKGKPSNDISLRCFKLTDSFDRVETGSVDGSRKPEAIQHILDSFPDITKEEVIYVGDSPGDIKDSRKAGVAVVAAAWAESADANKLKALHPDELFTSIPDFSDWLYQKI